MAGNKSVSLTVNMLANAAPAVTTFTNLANMIRSKPIKISASVGKIDSSNAQTAVNEIQAKAQSIEKIIIKTKTYLDMAGNEINEPVKMITEYTDKLGNAQKKTQTLIDTLKTNTLYSPKGGAGALQETKTSTIDIRAQGKIIEQERNKNLAQMALANKKAEEWSNRAQSMSKKEATAIQAQTEKVQKLSIAYERALKRGSSGSRILKQWELENKELDKQIDLTKRAATGVQGWAENIKRAFVQSVSYATSLGVLRLAQQALNQAIQYAIELNKEMVNIQILQVKGAQTPEEINALAQSFNNLAKEMGATTIEIAQGSVEWLRQGKSIAETEKLLRASTMMGKLGNMTLADSTESLTSILNSFKLEAEDAVSIVDRLVAVDNVAATSTRELAIALKYVAAVAGEAGVTLEQLVSYIAVISQTTRLNAEQIGQALKTMFTRMQDIQKGGLDEDGMGINNVEIALKRVDIKLRDSETSFRDFGTVLEELAGKWDTLNEIEQANIGKSIAGVRQANMFRILMTNMNEAIELQEVQFNSAGLAVDRYGFYLNSVEGSANTLKASLQGLFMSFGETDKIIIGINKAGSAILDFITRAGGLKTIIAGLTVALIGFGIQGIQPLIVKLTAYAIAQGIATGTTLTFVGAVEAALVAVTSFFATNPVGWAILAVTAIGALSLAFDSAAEKMQKFTDKIIGAQEQLTGLSRKEKDIRALAEEFNNLKDKESLTSNETERLIEVQNELKALLPELAVKYDVYGNALFDAKVDVDELTKSTLDLIDAQKKVIIENAKSSADNLQEMFYETHWRWAPDVAAQKELDFQSAKATAESAFAVMGEKDRDDYIAKLTDGGELQKAFIAFRKQLDTAAGKFSHGGWFPVTKALFDEGAIRSAISGIKGAYSEIENVRSKLASDPSYPDLAEIARLKGLGIELERTGDSYSLTDDVVTAYIETIREQVTAGYAVSASDQAMLDGITAVGDGAGELTVILASLQGQINAVSGAMKEQNETGYLSNETVMKLMQSNSELAQYLSIVNGQWKLDTDAIIVNMTAKAIEAHGTALLNVKLAEEALAHTKNTAASYDDAVMALEVAKAKAIEARATLDVIRQLKNVTIAYSGATSAVKDYNDAVKDGYNAQIKSYEAEKKALLAKLAAYKKIIDAKKESLRLDKEEADYTKELSKKQKTAADLMAEIEQLKLDNSAEANAKRLELEAELADAQLEIQEFQADRSYDLKMEALDKEYELFKDMIDKQIEAIDLLIEKIRELIDALADANANAGVTTNPLPDEEKDPLTWEELIQHEKDNDLAVTMHEGGVVGDLAANEEFAKLMKGEVVVNKDQMDAFMNRTMPEITSTGGSNNITFEMPITVGGNLDKTVLPDLEAMVNKAFEKMNSTLLNRGYKRGVEQIF